MTDTHTEALKPCPFCGGEACIGETEDHIGQLYPTATCSICPAEIAALTEAEAIAAWNARAAIEALPARNDERALKLVEALTAQASAELLRCGCTECDGEGDWTHCSVCSVHFGRAIDLRSAALADTQPSGETR